MPMRYLFKVSVVLYLCLTSVNFSFAAEKIIFSANELEYIRSHHVVKYGLFPRFYPIETTNDFGEHIGLTRDYLDLISAATGIRFQLVPSNSGNESYMNLKQGRVSLLTSTSAAFAEQNGMAYSASFFSTWPVTVTRNNTRNVTTPEDITEGYVSITDYLSLIQWFIQRFPGVDYKVSPSPENTIESVVKGNAVAAVVLSPTAYYYMNSIYPGQLKMSRPHSAKIPLVMSANQEDKVLIDIINKVLASVSPLHQSEIAAKWIIPDKTQQENLPLSEALLWGLISILLLVILSFCYYHWRLKAKIAQLASKNHLELSVISHELRTPLIGILTASEGLLERITSFSQRERLSSIIHVTRGLLDNLDLSLDYAKINAGSVKQNPQPHLLVDLCDTTVRLFVSFAEQNANALQIRYASKQYFLPHLVDSTLLGQALNNIVSNAIKHTQEGMVLIECSLVQVDYKNMFCIEVTDTGVGIPENVLKRLSEPFYQGIDNETTTKGTGLGLFVAKKNMQLMGGHLVLTSKPGVGSRVKIAFPVIPAHYAIEHPLPDGLLLQLIHSNEAPWHEVTSVLDSLELPYCFPANHMSPAQKKTIIFVEYNHISDQWQLGNPQGKEYTLPRPLYASAFHQAVIYLCNDIYASADDAFLPDSTVESPLPTCIAERRLLLVEDEPLLLEVQYELFTSMGFVVDTASNTQQAYQSWLQHRHSLIITDCRLDESDGFELVRHLRKLMLDNPTAVLIIGQSAALKPEDAQLAREVGMDYLLQKPIAREQWQAIIHDYFVAQEKADA
ncbi:response regulator [Enterobacter mori]|nr:response regulator [Enterobacter mori]